jgi:hypothetical protein
MASRQTIAGVGRRVSEPTSFEEGQGRKQRGFWVVLHINELRVLFLMSIPIAWWRTLARKKQALALFTRPCMMGGEPEGKLQVGPPLVI